MIVLRKMKTSLFIILNFVVLISILRLSACQTETKHLNKSISEIKITNALDTICGDKIISNDGRIKRPNNLKSLLNVQDSDLKKTSKLYKIKFLGNDLHLIQQKKDYSKARQFDLVISAKDRKINNYFALNDFDIIDAELMGDGLVILSSNFHNSNEYWKSENEIKVIRLDSDLKVVWQYSAKGKSYKLDGNELNIENEKTKALINVITGCDMCYSIVEIEIDQNGKCINAGEKNKLNSKIELNQSELNLIFRVNNNTL